MDTVNDGAWQNFWGRGFVDGPQLNEFDALLQAHQGPHDARHLRILATHHPIHFPTPRPGYKMVIANEDSVGQFLSSASPLVHLVLSGHTHALFPKHGQLPHSPRMCAHDPLGTDQCQLVIGTLMQVDRFQKRGDDPHQCQVLRFHQDPGTPDLVVMQRLLAARNPYSNQPRIDYDFVSVPGQGDDEEELVIAL